MSYLVIIPILAFLIIIHELGHFFAARSVGVKVEEFGIGLPPRVKGWTRKGVLWSINAIPFGGFVRVKGEDANDREPGSMQVASPWARAWFLLAGPLMNLLAAVLISIIMVAVQGLPTSISPLYIGTVEPNSPAEQAGWQPGDRILAVNGESMDTTDEVISTINAHAGQNVNVTVQRGNETLQTTVVPREDPPANQGPTGIGFDRGTLSEVYVQSVEANSTAAASGLQRHDQIIAINGVEIEALAQAGGILNASVGQDATLTVMRDGQEQDLTLHVPSPSIELTEVRANSPASSAGLYSTDRIIAVNGQPVSTGRGFITMLHELGGTTVGIDFIRTTDTGQIQQRVNLNVPPMQDVDVADTLDTIGFGALAPSGFALSGLQVVGQIVYDDVPLSRVIPEGFRQFWGLITGTVDSIRNLFSGRQELGSVVGPIGMAQVTGQMLDSTTGDRIPLILNMTMLISVSLGILNLLPFPALDGGRLVFVILEILRGGKRVPPEKEGMVHLIGMLVLLGLMFVIAFADIQRIFSGGSVFQ